MAFEYYLLFSGITAPIRADFDERYSRFSPGTYLMYAVLRELFADGHRAVTEYNTCGSDYAFLLRWTRRSRTHEKLLITPKNLYGLLLCAWARPKRLPPRGTREGIASCRPARRERGWGRIFPPDELDL